VLRIGVIMSSSPGQPASPPLTQRKDFWVLMGYAVVLGVIGAFAGLAFMGVTGAGNNWFTGVHLGWFSGQWWWLAVTVAAGLVVGLLRRWIRLPGQIPGLVAGLRDEKVDYSLVPGVVIVSAVSLIGGASLGPEKALGYIGGGTGTWIARHRGLGKEDSQANTLDGYAGAYGGLFSSTVIVVMMIMEVARPGGRRLGKALAGCIVASSVSSGIYFAIAGALFLGAYHVPKFAFHDWQLLAGVPLGLFAALVVTLLGACMTAAARLFGRLNLPAVASPVLGGAVFGLAGVALPLTMFTGSGELGTALGHAATMGAGLIAATMVGKMITFAVSEASGFVGGPIFPAIFIGGMAGLLVHLVIPDVPLGLSFACLLAAVPGSLVAAPFSMVLLAAFLTQVGALQTAPVLIAVITAFLTVEGVRYLAGQRKKPAQPGQHPAARPQRPAPG
jgi:H+/Cl- antiporter ClcA